MHVYFSGAGGVGIGPLAILALDAGFTVTGSDLQPSEMTETLKKRGATILIGQDGSQIKSVHEQQPVDWFVHSSALKPDHPELVFAIENKLKTSKRDGFLNHLLEVLDLQMIAVAGTHGKTTTTGMLVWLFKQLGLPVSYSVGTSISFGAPAAYEPGSQYFVYECDEFDKNFLQYRPYISVVTSVDYDHPDTYPTAESYNEAFKQFASQSDRVLIWQHDANKIGLTASETTHVLPPEAVSQSLELPGIHNRENGTLAVKILEQLFSTYETSRLEELLAQFPGTNRRFERLAHNLYTDYAHHPTEIAATIQMAKELNDSVIVVYQPHQNVRQNELVKAGAYKHCFDDAAQVYWLPTYLSREYKDLKILSPEEIIATTSKSNHIKPAEMDATLWSHIQSHIAKGALVVAMNAGNLDEWLRSQAAR